MATTDAFEQIEEVRDRLLWLLRRRDPAGVLFRPASVEAAIDPKRLPTPYARPANANPNEFPIVTIDAQDEASAMFSPGSPDATIGEWEELSDDDPDNDYDPEFDHAQDYVCTVIHEGEQKQKNARTDRNVVAAWMEGGPKLRDPGADATSALAYVVGWAYRAARTLEWVGSSARWVTRFTVTVNMVLTRSEILAVALPDPARKGEI